LAGPERPPRISSLIRHVNWIVVTTVVVASAPHGVLLVLYIQIQSFSNTKEEP